MNSLQCFVLILFCLSGSLGKQGFGPGEQEWGHVEVRPQAHMFWWLYYTTAKVNSFYDKPLVIWLQGGPGASSTSFGNFMELGPLDDKLEYRNFTWVKDYNVLFIDNPVGTGFSYVESASSYTKNNTQIALDLCECMKGFLEKLPEFVDIPTYILSESYGGKMAAEFAYIWYQKQSSGEIKSNLKAVGLGDSWISPIDSVLTWAPFLYYTGMVDTAGQKVIEKAALRVQTAISEGRWVDATTEWGNTENVILRVTNNIDFYNILTKVSGYQFGRNMNFKKTDLYDLYIKEKIETASLDSLMNTKVKDALGLKVRHQVQSGSVFNYLYQDFMKPVVHVVERLLDETPIDVYVYTGNMDLIVDTPGTLFWVENMKWKYADSWTQSPRKAVLVDGTIEGYSKIYKNLKYYSLTRAGHMVPSDNFLGMAKILEDMTNRY